MAEPAVRPLPLPLQPGAAWLALLPVHRRGKALQVGPGTGAAAAELALWYREVWCADPPEGPTPGNVYVREADPFDLPFEEGSFDLVTVRGGVLDRAPRERQRAFLEGCRRRLRHGGILHAAVAGALAPWTGRGGPGARRPAGWTRLLADAGFEEPEVLWVRPEPERPEAAGLLRDRRTLREWLRWRDRRRAGRSARSRAGAVLLALGLDELLAPHLYLVARRPGP